LSASRLAAVSSKKAIEFGGCGTWTGDGCSLLLLARASRPDPICDNDQKREGRSSFMPVSVVTLVPGGHLPVASDAIGHPTMILLAHSPPLPGVRDIGSLPAGEAWPDYPPRRSDHSPPRGLEEIPWSRQHRA